MGGDTTVRYACKEVDKWRIKNGFCSTRDAYMDLKIQGFSADEICIALLFENYDFYDKASV